MFFIINGILVFLLIVIFLFFIIVIYLPKNDKKFDSYSKIPFSEKKDYKSTSGDNSE